MTDKNQREQSIQVVRAYVNGMNTWDFDSLANLLDERVILEIPYAPAGFDKRYEGREKIMALSRAVSELMPALNLHDIDIDTLHSNPEKVLCTYKSNARIGDRHYQNDYITRWTVHNGRITYWNECFDSVRFVVATGGEVVTGSFSDA